MKKYIVIILGLIGSTLISNSIAATMQVSNLYDPIKKVNYLIGCPKTGYCEIVVLDPKNKTISAPQDATKFFKGLSLDKNEIITASMQSSNDAGYLVSSKQNGLQNGQINVWQLKWSDLSVNANKTPTGFGNNFSKYINQGGLSFSSQSGGIYGLNAVVGNTMVTYSDDNNIKTLSDSYSGLNAFTGGAANLSTVVNMGDGNIYFFKNDQYITYNIASNNSTSVNSTESFLAQYNRYGKTLDDLFSAGDPLAIYVPLNTSDADLDLSAAVISQNNWSSPNIKDEDGKNIMCNNLIQSSIVSLTCYTVTIAADKLQYYADKPWMLDGRQLQINGNNGFTGIGVTYDVATSGNNVILYMGIKSSNGGTTLSKLSSLVTLNNIITLNRNPDINPNPQSSNMFYLPYINNRVDFNGLKYSLIGNISDLKLNYAITSLAAEGNNVYGLTDDEAALFVSNNNGKTFFKNNIASNIRSMVADQKGHLYILYSNKLQVSVDGGKTFSNIESSDMVGGASLMYVENNILYVASSESYIYKSIDYGKSFTTIKTGNIGTIFYLYVKNNNIYVVTSIGMFISLDGGKTFTASKTISKPALTMSTVGMAVDSQGIIYYQYVGVLYRSTDNGKTFTTLNPPAHASVFPILYVDNFDNLILSTLTGLAVSKDHGNTYTAYNNFSSDNNTHGITADPSGLGFYYIDWSTLSKYTYILSYPTISIDLGSLIINNGTDKPIISVTNGKWLAPHIIKNSYDNYLGHDVETFQPRYMEAITMPLSILSNYKQTPNLLDGRGFNVIKKDGDKSIHTSIYDYSIFTDDTNTCDVVKDPTCNQLITFYMSSNAPFSSAEIDSLNLEENQNPENHTFYFNAAGFSFVETAFNRVAAFKRGGCKNAKLCSKDHWIDKPPTESNICAQPTGVKNWQGCQEISIPLSSLGEYYQKNLTQIKSMTLAEFDNKYSKNPDEFNYSTFNYADIYDYKVEGNNIRLWLKAYNQAPIDIQVPFIGDTCVEYLYALRDSPLNNN
ncbi:WD40/YVTN/BNR-like repeat-containing protein [Rickettsiales bacterium LUAb2]